MWDDILSFVVVAIPTVLGIAGWLMPVTQSGTKHRWYLAVGGALLSVLIFLQQHRASTAHEAERSQDQAQIKQMQDTVSAIKKDSERPIQVPTINVQVPSSVAFHAAPAEKLTATISDWPDYDHRRFVVRGPWPGRKHQVPCVITVWAQPWNGGRDGGTEVPLTFNVQDITSTGATWRITVAEPILKTLQYLMIEDKE